MKNFNLGFHKPRKDKEHITNKNMTRLVKQNVKP